MLLLLLCLDAAASLSRGPDAEGISVGPRAYDTRWTFDLQTKNRRETPSWYVHP